MRRLGADLEEKQEPRVASLAEAQKPKRKRVTHEVTRATLDTGRDREAIVAVARRLAVVLHRMWVDGSEFRWSKDSAAAPTVA